MGTLLTSAGVWIKWAILVVLNHASGLLTLLEASIVMGILLALPDLIPSLLILIENWSAKHLSEKISLRVKDAFEKLGTIVQTIVAAEAQLASQEVVQAIKEGKHDHDTILKIIGDLTKKAMEMIGPEIPTLEKYFFGSSLESFIAHSVQAHVVAFVKSHIAETPTDVTLSIK